MCLCGRGTGICCTDKTARRRGRRYQLKTGGKGKYRNNERNKAKIYNKKGTQRVSFNLFGLHKQKTSSHDMIRSEDKYGKEKNARDDPRRSGMCMHIYDACSICSYVGEEPCGRYPPNIAYLTPTM